MQQQQETKPMFDDALISIFREAIKKAGLEHGDVLDSVAVVINYRGSLPMAPGIQKAIWLKADGGPVLDAVGITGAVQTTLFLLQEQLVRARELSEQVQADLTQLLKQTKEAHEQHNDQRSAPDAGPGDEAQ